MGRYCITPHNLWALIGRSETPQIIDVRRHQVFIKDHHMIPGASWRDHHSIISSPLNFDKSKMIVLYCVHGHQVSQSAVASLRASGINAVVLQGGIEAWKDANFPTIRKSNALFNPEKPGQLWVTRRHPKIERIACPWLIKRFMDPQARFLFVDADQVLTVAKEVGAIAFDVEGAPIGHSQNLCSFDALLSLSGLKYSALDAMAEIIRGADTGDMTLAPECAGLLALSKGLSALYEDEDHCTLDRGLIFYDALYAFQKIKQKQTENA